MNLFHNPIKKIKVCTGPGCQSWQSAKILSLLRKVIGRFPGSGDVQVHPVKCMNKCSGGVTAKMSPSGEIIKWREPEEALEVLARQGPTWKSKGFVEKDWSKEKEPTK